MVMDPQEPQQPEYGADPQQPAPLDEEELYPSGHGGPAPPSVVRMGRSWGALLSGWVWAVSNRVWLGLLDLPFIINPLIWIPFRILLAYKGNEWAWQARRFEGVEQFRRAQRRWATWGVLVLAAQLCLVVFCFWGLGRVAPLMPSGGG
jgi:hypothetical protein